MSKKVLEVGKAFADRLVKRGARAVVLFGSWVRGDAYRESDLDILAIGRGPHHQLERYQGFLISLSWSSAREVLRSFKDCGKVGCVIPAWRNAVILYDPEGIASTIKQEAKEWRWGTLGQKSRKMGCRRAHQLCRGGSQIGR